MPYEDDDNAFLELCGMTLHCGADTFRACPAKDLIRLKKIDDEMRYYFDGKIGSSLLADLSWTNDIIVTHNQVLAKSPPLGLGFKNAPTTIYYVLAPDSIVVCYDNLKIEVYCRSDFCEKYPGLGK